MLVNHTADAAVDIERIRLKVEEGLRHALVTEDFLTKELNRMSTWRQVPKVIKYKDAANRSLANVKVCIAQLRHAKVLAEAWSNLGRELSVSSHRHLEDMKNIPVASRRLRNEPENAWLG